MKKTIALSLGALTVLLSAPFAFAAVGLEADGSAIVNVNVGNSKSNTSVSATAETNVSTSREAGTGKATGREAATGIVTTGLPAQASATATLNARVGLENPIVLDRAGAKLGTTSVRVISISSVSVSSEEEFRALAESMLATDSRIKLIRIESDDTEVDYQYNGRFLGIIPVKPVLRATLTSEGKVKVTFPWYEIFVRRTTLVSEADIATNISAQTDSSAAPNSLNARARALVALSAALKGNNVGEN